jgi:Flp pilus assembly pilin Flp
MKLTNNFFRSLRQDNRGQDLIEYALMASFVAVAVAAIVPVVFTLIQVIFAKITCAHNSGVWDSVSQACRIGFQR